jgi:RNA polymerase sigma-70 factor (ECF subfamily)
MADLSQSTSISYRTPPASAPEDQDVSLLRRMGDGDESALATLYDRWSNRVHTTAFWILQDADDAEDVVEETFWQAWRTASHFEPERASASTWLLLLARSRALDRLRARRRRTQRMENLAASTVLDQLDGQSDAVALQPESSKSSSALADALAALPPEQREALQLAFFEGLSHAEIAAKTALPLGTIKTRIRLAIDKLRLRLGNLRGQIP